MRTRLTAVLLALPLATLLAPGAAAHPADVFLFPITPTAPPPLFCPPAAGLGTPGCYMLPPFTVVGVSNTVGTNVVGAGACNIEFEACFAWPAWNPFRLAVPAYWWCQVTWHTPNWPAVPPAAAPASIQAHLVYDGPAPPVAGVFPPDDLLVAGDFIASTVPIGPIPIPAGAPRAGQWTGGAFGAGFPVGSIAHIVVTDFLPQFDPIPLGLARPLRDTVVTCWVW